MNTVDIGSEFTPAVKPSMHVVSADIGLESRVDAIGEDGAVFHVRTIDHVRRMVLTNCLSAPAGVAVLDALEGLPDLPPMELVDAVTHCAARHARSCRASPAHFNLCALRIDRHGVQWASSGPATLLRHRRASAWRAANIQLLHSVQEQAATVSGGMVRLRSGDEVIAWAGNGLGDEWLANLFADPIGLRAIRRLGTTASSGCLATLRKR